MSEAWSQAGGLRPELFKDQLDNGEFSRLIFELSAYGLTRNQARIYIFLLTTGVTPARRISRLLGLHRVEVYRKLRELEELGLVELHLSSPKRYSATGPKEALSTLLRYQEQRLKTSRERSTGLVKGLDKLRSETGLGPKIGESDSSYKLVVGQSRYINELRTRLKSAQHEVLRIVSAGGVIRTFLAGLEKDYANANLRGISIRMITTVTPRNRKYVRKLSKVVQIRHLDGVRLRFTVVDRSIAILAARFDENSMSISAADNSYLVFEDQKLAEAFCFFFEHLWADARPRNPRRRRTTPRTPPGFL